MNGADHYCKEEDIDVMSRDLVTVKLGLHSKPMGLRRTIDHRVSVRLPRRMRLITATGRRMLVQRARTLVMVRLGLHNKPIGS